MSTQPLFDMSKAQPIQAAQAPLFDMSKAQPIGQQTQAAPPDPGLWDRMSRRIKGNLDIGSQIKNVADQVSGAIHDVKTRGLFPPGVHRLPEVLETLKKTYSDPANVLGDVITGLMAHAAGTGPEAGNVAPQPEAPPAEAPIPQTGESIQAGLSRANTNQPLDPYAAARAASEPPPPAVATVPTRPSVERIQPTSQSVKPAAVEKLLNEATGGEPLKPTVPLREQVTAKTPDTAKTAESLPSGFTPVESSAIKGYKYDPAKQELEVVSANGQRYIHGDVSADQAEAFESAESKGKAWNDLRSNSTLAAKFVNGKRVAVKPPKALSSSTPEALIDPLERMLQQVKAGKKLGDLQ